MAELLGYLLQHHFHSVDFFEFWCHWTRSNNLLLPIFTQVSWIFLKILKPFSIMHDWFTTLLYRPEAFRNWVEVCTDGQFISIKFTSGDSVWWLTRYCSSIACCHPGHRDGIMDNDMGSQIGEEFLRNYRGAIREWIYISCPTELFPSSTQTSAISSCWNQLYLPVAHCLPVNTS